MPCSPTEPVPEVGPNPLSDWIRRNPTTVVLDRWLFFSSIEGCSWHLGLLPPARAPSSPGSSHLWGTERGGPQTSMEEKITLNMNVVTRWDLSLPSLCRGCSQHILGYRKKEDSFSVLLEPEDWWLWPPPPQATVHVSNSTWLGLFLSLWFSKENGQLNCFKNNMNGFWNSFFFFFPFEISGVLPFTKNPCSKSI